MDNFVKKKKKKPKKATFNLDELDNALSESGGAATEGGPTENGEMEVNFEVSISPNFAAIKRR